MEWGRSIAVFEAPVGRFVPSATFHTRHSDECWPKNWLPFHFFLVAAKSSPHPKLGQIGGRGEGLGEELREAEGGEATVDGERGRGAEGERRERERGQGRG